MRGRCACTSKVETKRNRIIKQYVMECVYYDRFTRNVDLMRVTFAVGLSRPATASATMSTSSTYNSSLISATSAAGGSRENQNSTIISGKFRSCTLLASSELLLWGICSRALLSRIIESQPVFRQKGSNSNSILSILLTYTICRI